MQILFKKPLGFTLIELMIAIAMVVVVLTIAIPSFQSTIQNNYSVSLANDLINAFNFARSEAIKRNVNVSVCAASDQTFSSCGTDWNQGWMIFTDPNGSGLFSSSSTLLRTNTITGQNANITSSPTINAATYNNAGFAASSTANVVYTVNATGCKGDYARTITISMTGRLVIAIASCP